MLNFAENLPNEIVQRECKYQALRRLAAHTHTYIHAYIQLKDVWVCVCMQGYILYYTVKCVFLNKFTFPYALSLEPLRSPNIL